jgi:general secretion pathway protein J
VKRAGGFTLIEVLIAMAITALVATLSFSSLSSVLSTVESLREHGERTAEMNRAWTIVSRDLRQFTQRPVRDQFGAAESAMFGGAAVGQSLSFTRTGWHNSNLRLRSELQRVRYRLEDNILWRESYFVLDRNSDSEAQRVELIRNVVDFEVAFLGASTEVRGEELDTENWPTNWGVNASNRNVVEPPQAVELRLELEDWGELRWLYDLPGL